jgi:hypothetical protein
MHSHARRAFASSAQSSPANINTQNPFLTTPTHRPLQRRHHQPCATGHTNPSLPTPITCPLHPHPNPKPLTPSHFSPTPSSRPSATPAPCATTTPGPLPSSIHNRLVVSNPVQRLQPLWQVHRYAVRDAASGQRQQQPGAGWRSHPHVRCA